MSSFVDSQTSEIPRFFNLQMGSVKFELAKHIKHFTQVFTGDQVLLSIIQQTEKRKSYEGLMQSSLTFTLWFMKKP